MTSRKKRIIVGTLAIYVLVCYILVGNPDASFRSSDSNWADSEYQIKGRDFDDIVFLFEGYKIKCTAPTANLVRTTPKNLFNVFAWPGYLIRKKWSVPYEPEDPQIGTHYPHASQNHCYNEGWKPEVSKLAEINMELYIEQL